jgi:hypothetical protein
LVHSLISVLRETGTVYQEESHRTTTQCTEKMKECSTHRHRGPLTIQTSAGSSLNSAPAAWGLGIRGRGMRVPSSTPASGVEQGRARREPGAHFVPQCQFMRDVSNVWSTTHREGRRRVAVAVAGSRQQAAGSGSVGQHSRNEVVNKEHKLGVPPHGTIKINGRIGAE